MPARARDHPSGKGEQGQRVDGRRIVTRRPVGDADVARLALRRLAHQPRDVGDRGVGPRGGHPDADRSLDIQRPGVDRIAEPYGLRRALAGQQRQVDPAGAADNDTVRRQALARRDEHDHAGLKRGGVDPSARLVGADDHRAGPHVAEQRGHPAARAVAHHAVEPAAAEQEEEQHHDAVEICVGTVGRGFVEAERGRDQHPDADRHVHIGPAVAHRAPRRTEEAAPGIGDGRQRDRRREPVKEVARRAASARPDRHRQQHDVHHREARDRDRAQQRPAVGCAAIDLGRAVADRMRLEPQQREGADQVRRFGVGGAGDMHALFGEIDPRRRDPPVAHQPLLQLGDAAGAADVGHREIALDEQGSGMGHLRSIR